MIELARPQRKRTICCEPDYVHFTPDGISPTKPVALSLDEFEVIRLVDYEKKTHEQTARFMNIARTTVTEIYESARYKISDCLINGKQLIISGGNYQLCKGQTEYCANRCCQRKNHINANITMQEKGSNTMRIAVTYENGKVFQHFGHTETFKLYDVEGEQIKNEQIVATNGSGHGALAGFLKANCVDVLICGGIGGGAQTALKECGIKLFGGVDASADEAVKNYLSGKLNFNPDVHCNHHDNEHGNEAHHCGEHGCGNHNCNH